MGMFYEYYSMIVSKYPEGLQGAINTIIRLFRKVGLMANVAKSKIITCQSGAICTGVSEKYFSLKS